MNDPISTDDGRPAHGGQWPPRYSPHLQEDCEGWSAVMEIDNDGDYVPYAVWESTNAALARAIAGEDHIYEDLSAQILELRAERDAAIRDLAGPDV